MGIQSNIRDALLPQPPSFKKKKEYSILETLGRGGFGKVVKAHWKCEGEGKDVALKYVPLSLFYLCYLRCLLREVIKRIWRRCVMGENKKELIYRIIPKKLVKHDLSLVTDEINVLKSLDHPNIVHVWDHFESRDK
jgi:calcium/calmodulin-dependent protein kinase I